MKLINRNNKTYLCDNIYGKVCLFSDSIIEYIKKNRKLSKNHVFGFYGVFQMTKTTKHFYSIYEDNISFLIFMIKCEVPEVFLEKYIADTSHMSALYYPMNYGDQHNITDNNTLNRLYMIHQVIRLSYYYEFITRKYIYEKLLYNIKIRYNNQSLVMIFNTPIIQYILNDLTLKINTNLFFDKCFIAYQFLTKKIIQDAIFYGVFTWEDFNTDNTNSDIYYVDKILNWAHKHTKNDMCWTLYMLYKPNFECVQIPTHSQFRIITWDIPFIVEYKPLKYSVCSFSLKKSDVMNTELYYNNIIKTDKDNYFISYTKDS
jgi:hypothetical protein